MLDAEPRRRVMCPTPAPGATHIGSGEATGLGDLPQRSKVVVRVDFGAGCHSVRYSAEPEVVARFVAALAVWNPGYRVYEVPGPVTDVRPLPGGKWFDAEATGTERLSVASDSVWTKRGQGQAWQQSSRSGRTGRGVR